MKTLYPMDMDEFMLALGEDDLVEQKVLPNRYAAAVCLARCRNAALPSVSCGRRYARVRDAIR